MKNKTIFVACDTSNLEKIKKIVLQAKTSKFEIIPKFGLQFFYSKQGRKFLENIKDLNNGRIKCIRIKNTNKKLY